MSPDTRPQLQAAALSPCLSVDSAFVSRERSQAPLVVAPSVPVAGEQAASDTRANKASWSASSDVALLAILEAPLHVGETAAIGFARKELELRHVLATLSVLESRALQKRLSNPKSGDQLAQSFTRLTADRRARLICFLADARRREALAR